MTRTPLFNGLVFDENDQLVASGNIGSEPCYIIDDAGFKHHIPSEKLDLEILSKLGEQIKGNEELIADQAAKLSGQDDLFSHALIENQLKNVEKQYQLILQTGIPEDTKAYLGMMGFKVIIDIHGTIIDIIQPGRIANDDDPGKND